MDANQVHHFFEYDPWGYPKRTTEGLLEGGRSVWVNPVVTGPGTNDGLGRPYLTYIMNDCYGQVFLDANGRPVECLVGCPMRDGHPFVRQGLVPSPEASPFMECFGTAQHDVVGRLLHVDRCGATVDAGSFRRHDVQYDDLGRPTQYTIQTGVDGQPGWQFDRRFLSQGYDAEGGLVSLQGPDGQTTQHLFNGQPGYDELGRPRTVSRSGMSATFSYDAASRVTQVDYGNGAKILRHYDEADRLQWIEHRDASNNLLLRIDYAWNTDNTVSTRTEQNVVTGQTAVVTFAYDRRDRLTAETRVVNGTTTVYDITYTYDPLGNRLQKRDYAAGRKTDYYYDSVEQNRDPNWRTNDNRLLWYVESADNGQGGWTALRTVRYTYYETGHVSNITIKDEWTGGGTPPPEYNYYHDLALYYTSAGKLWRVLWDKWKVDAQGNFTDYTKVAAREFYYDGARQRYVVRDVDPNSWVPPPMGTQHWTDYDGVLPYGDFDQQFSQYPSFTLTEQMRYSGEFGTHAQQTAGAGETSYLHGDMARSTMATTDDVGQPAGTLAYTAFGEPVGDADALGTRYQYAGAWGYESGLLSVQGANLSLPPITLQHVGARWYQPTIGRFTQRDPVGIAGGLNTYAYVENEPLSSVDPDGLTKGGKEHIRPSDLPPYWDKLSKKERIGWLKGAIKAAKSAKHKLVLEGFLKVFKRGNKFILIGALLLDPPQSFADCVNELIWPVSEFVHFEPPPPGSDTDPTPDPPACFVTGTPVWTPGGLVPIERIRIGDAVLAGNAETGQLEWGTVVDVLRGGEQEILSIQIGRESVRCSSEHKFMVAGRGWVPARELLVGEEIQLADGARAQVVNCAVTIHERRQSTHNLHVEPQQNFLVGESGIVVHNFIDFIK